MSNIEELMTDFYNILVQIRYPKITTASIKNLELTILSGENRLSLLSWLLAEKSPATAVKLQKLKGTALEEELLMSYSEIGICSNKKLLLGNCSLEKQIPTLRLLLDFIKCIFIESSEIKYDIKKSTDDILNVYTIEDSSTFTYNIEPQLNYSESIEYFDNLQKCLNEHQELSSIYKSENKEYLMEHDPCEVICNWNITEKEMIFYETDENKENNKVDQDLLFNEEKKKFIETFLSIESCKSIFDAKTVTNNIYSMDADINDIYTNFSSLIQFLQARKEILETNIPKEIKKSNTPLSEIIENTVRNTEEAINVKLEN
ncbi:uncharacterized protein LOC122718667 [Apis laboriosa]|uniref:uncharacterized protein LOC122718667 n=1 Tax=Apis laboriosa TaxID=183418 RepID=UPI001CC5F687|nr:uncharacterized protein LOC122718667 [Apis laboriosa]